jgi:hypothetical protein
MLAFWLSARRKGEGKYAAAVMINVSIVNFRRAKPGGVWLKITYQLRAYTDARLTLLKT